jgi:tetratricopeptide (TPR) repeat protein
MRVSRKLWAILLGVATFVLPAISALLKHFGLDFETQAGQGFDLYLAVARVIFDQLSPTVLTAVLGLCTGLVWWSCRPRAEDVFWDLGVAGPETRLRRVREELRKGSDGAVDELKAIVDAFPQHWPARLLLAEWHYHTEDYRHSLDDYRLALGHEAGAPEDYLRASLSASHLGDKREALRLIQDAETRLGEAKLLPAMLFNAGCYSSLLGEPDKAMSYLRKAVAAGSDDIAAYSRDSDLDSLRHRQDFQELLDGDLAVHFACPHCDCPCSAPVSTAGTRRQCMKCKGVVSIPPWE